MNYEATRDETTGRWDIKGLEPSDRTFHRICDLLETKVAFKFARYGDGEFNCMFGKQGRNCDGHEYFPELGVQLTKSLLRADYMVGIQPLALTLYPERIEPMITGLDIYNADAIHNASIDGELPSFLKALSGRYIILVGPAHLASVFDGVHIVIPSVNCWTEYENVRNQIEFHTDGVNNAVVLLAASMMSEVIIDEFADSYHTFIDIGSVLDPYVGVKSRRYHHKLKI